MEKVYLQGLNSQQALAVEHINGPLMIVAGAGSGKTKVLTNRIAHLLDKGTDAFSILALTFTNKAANEMKERIDNLLQNKLSRNLYIGTFHSIFARILRYEAHHLGYPRDFSIYDTDDVKSLLKFIVTDLNLDIKIYKPNTLSYKISSLKNQLIFPAEYKADTFNEKNDERARIPLFATIYQRYVDSCFKNGGMDFDDLLLQMFFLLTDFPEVLYKYQIKFKYILIDEYQDTNHLQYTIIKMLAAQHNNICVVGDDAQSIYSFRGASVKNILQFENDYAEVTKIKLEQNYRSTPTILDAANTLIKKNKKQIDKALWTHNADGDKIYLVCTSSENDEGRFVADAITEQKLRYHFENKDFAILYRTNAQSRAFEEFLRRLNVPYVIYGGTSFYARKEIKDFIAYLKVVCNPKDEISLKRIINYPTRGIGNNTIEIISTIANEKNISLWEVILTAREHGLKNNALNALNDFATMIKYFISLDANSNAHELAIIIGKHSKIVKELFDDKTIEGIARYENIQAFLNSLKEYVETPDENGELLDKTLSSFLQHISLLTDVDTKNTNNDDVVKLMTIHAAKGLEFENVFIVGLEEGLFPNTINMQGADELEEERRLFYVAITRAKSKLWLSYANTRFNFGVQRRNEPSRFLQEVPETLIDFSYAKKSFENPVFRQFKKINTTPIYEKETFSKISIQKIEIQNTHQVSENFITVDSSKIKEQHRIEHTKFGFGIVNKIEGSDINPIAIIHFDKYGEKKIVLNYAKISIVNK